MKCIILIITLICLSNCGPVSPLPTQPRTVDAALEPYVSTFEGLWGQTANMDIQFATLGSNYAGYCTVDMDSPYVNGTRTIQIDSGYWSTIDAAGQEQLVYHELGHCALARVHWSALDTTNNCDTYTLAGNWVMGCPLTIMYPVVFGNNGNYSQNHEYYVAELFTNDPTHQDPNQSPIPSMGDDYEIKHLECPNSSNCKYYIQK
jgi:hypothetical protein